MTEEAKHYAQQLSRGARPFFKSYCEEQSDRVMAHAASLVDGGEAEPWQLAMLLKELVVLRRIKLTIEKELSNE